MTGVSLEVACDALQVLHDQFVSAEAIAHRVLDELEAEARTARIPGFRVVGRARDELFLTFAGYGIYFRFTYSSTVFYIAYGVWTTNQKGLREYHTQDKYEPMEWRITGDTVAGVNDWDDLRKMFYPAVLQVIQATKPYDWYRLTRHGLREFVPEVVSPIADAGR